MKIQRKAVGQVKVAVRDPESKKVISFQRRRLFRRPRPMQQRLAA